MTGAGTYYGSIGKKIMAQILARALDKDVVERLKKRANLMGQNIYDCLHVAVAAILNARMVTADRRLYGSVRNGQFKKISLVEDIR